MMEMKMIKKYAPPVKEKVVNESQYRLFGLQTRDLLKCLSSIILPLLLGVFTIFITIQQQKIAREHRAEDRQEAFQQRKEQLESAKQDRDNQLVITGERYRDEVLVAYIKEMGELLEKNNYSLTHHVKLAALTRAKTLNALSQLDGRRNSRVIGFLCETMLLIDDNETSVLDISTSVLVNIEKTILISHKQKGILSLTGTTIKNSSFNDVTLENINFSAAQLQDIDFTRTTMKKVSFSSSKLENISGIQSTLQSIDFHGTTLKNVNFSADEWHPQLRQSCEESRNSKPIAMLFQHDIDFRQSHIQRMNMENTRLKNVKWQNSELTNVSFAKGRLQQINFQNTKLVNVNFSHTRMSHIDFSSAHLDQVDFSYAFLKNVNFTAARLFNVNFTSAIVYFTTFDSAPLDRVYFISSILVSVSFKRSTFDLVTFFKASRMLIDVDSLVVHRVNFTMANMKGAHLVGYFKNPISFDGANLQKANISGAEINIDELKNALPFLDTILPAGYPSIGPPCTDERLKQWTLHKGQIKIVSSNETSQHCYLALGDNSTEAVLTKKVSLKTRWDDKLWPVSFGIIRTDMNDVGVLVELLELSGNGQLKKLQSFKSSRVFRWKLKTNQQEFIINITLYNPMTKTGDTLIRCNEIELEIEYGNGYETQRDRYDIPSGASWHPNAITVNVTVTRFFGFLLDEPNQRLFINDNRIRILSWKLNTNQYEIVAGDCVEGNSLHQLGDVVHFIIDEDLNALIVCDRGNRRIMRWSLDPDTTEGESLVTDIDCQFLALSERRELFVSDYKMHVIRRYSDGAFIETIIAGSVNIRGSTTNLLNRPSGIFIDRHETVYIADHLNNRIVKWMRGATDGHIALAIKFRKAGDAILSSPLELIVDSEDCIYFVGTMYHDITRWCSRTNKSDIVAGSENRGKGPNQLYTPRMLTFTEDGSLLVFDSLNYRLQKFKMNV